MALHAALLKHIVVVIAFLFSGGLAALIAALFGTDLFTNKVLLGEKLQPIQANGAVPRRRVRHHRSPEAGPSDVKVTSDRSTGKSIAGAKGKGDAESA